MKPAQNSFSMYAMLTGVFLSLFSMFSCKESTNQAELINANLTKSMIADGIKPDTATFGTGCFWCTEAIFQQLTGVVKVSSGYSGGHVNNPSYKEVCEGTTGHAEVVQVVYDPAKITFDELLEVFWQTHDPTTLNRQGNDVGTQYRSAIFYHNNEQKTKAEKYKAELDKSGAYDNKIVTEITAFKKFFVAEDYHQNYYNNNGSAPYCYYVIKPKLEKFQKVFKSKVKH